MDFSTFKNKYILTGKIVVLNALHIGSGREKDDRDTPFISLDDDKNFYIPGSTFRGYLSTKLERFLDSGNGFKIKNNGEELNEADVKLIFGYTNLDKLETKINDKDNEEDRKLKENNRKIQDRIIRKLNAKNLDEVKSLAGRIHVSDMPVLKDVKYVTRDGIKINRNTKNYEILMQWSKVFLLNKSFTTFSGNNNSRALLFSMEKVYESYVAKHLKKILGEDGWDVSSQDRSYYLFTEPRLQFALRPDIVCKRGERTIIMDTKWKKLVNNERINYGISQSDMYQMYAYSKKYKAKSGAKKYINEFATKDELEELLKNIQEILKKL